MTRSKGATTRLNDSSSRKRATLAAAESAAAFLAAASPDFSSASCLETDSVDSTPCQRRLGTRRRKIRVRLRQLLIDFGGFDFSQLLALGHGRSDVGFPALEVAAG